METLSDNAIQLIRQRNELEAVFHSITDILVVVSPDLTISDLNRAAIRYYGFDGAQSVIGQTYCETMCDRHNCRWAEGDNRRCMECNRNENCSDCHLRAVFANGIPVNRELELPERSYITSVSPVFDETGAVIKAVAMLRDITEIKQRSGEMIQSQKMQAVGHLAAGLAHEIRNPLGAIRNHVYILEDAIGGMVRQNDLGVPDAAISDSLSSIRHLVERSETIVKTILGFSSDKGGAIRVFLLKDLMDQVVVLVGKTAQQSHVAVIVEGDPSLSLESDSNALQHIIFNLVLNAIDSMHSGGEVSVVYSAHEDEIIITVADKGEGICREDVPKIYNPFYTTKAPGRGTGLGLFIVYNLVKRLSGAIEVKSEPGVGTSFSVRLPKWNIAVEKEL